MEFYTKLDLHYLASAEELANLGELDNGVSFDGEGFYIIEFSGPIDDWGDDDDSDTKKEVESAIRLSNKEALEYISRSLSVAQSAFALFKEREERLNQVELELAIDEFTFYKSQLEKHRKAMGRYSAIALQPYPEVIELKQENADLLNESIGLTSMEDITAWLAKYKAYAKKLSKAEVKIMAGS